MQDIKAQFSNHKSHLDLKAWLRENLQIGQNYDGVIYKLFTTNKNVNIPVSRIAGNDNDGILYIGKTTKPFERLTLLFRSFQNPPPKNKLWLHGAEEIYWQCPEVRKLYPFDKMSILIILCEDSSISEIEEISKYYLKFGEVPPFNGAIVKRNRK